MKKKIISVMLIGIVSLSLIGCGKEQKTLSENFKILSTDNLNTDDNDELWIVQEKSTGKRFIIYKADNKGGIVNLD